MPDILFKVENTTVVLCILVIAVILSSFLLLHFDNLRRQIPFREEQTSWHFNEMMQSFKRATKTHTYCVCVSMRPNMFFY